MKKLLFTLFVIGFIVNSNAQVPSYVPTDGLVAYYPFNGNANDESGNGNNGTVNGATLTSDRDGNENSSYSFDGANDLITVSAQSTIPPQSDYTVSFWFNSPTSDHNGPFLSFQRWFLTLGHVGTPGLFYKDERGNQDNSWYVQKYFGTEPSVNTWHNLVIKKTSTNVDLYLDTSYVGSITTYGVSEFNPDSLIQFGSYVTGMRYNGLLDDIGIWNRALTEEEVANLYISNSSSECSTLVINTGVLSTNPVTYNSTVSIYPNPANDQITIDCGNLDNVTGWNIKITNMLGQEVFSQPMNTQQYVIPLNTWTGKGMYFVKIINSENDVVNIKKIVLQ
jgi:hypothetical protein